VKYYYIEPEIAGGLGEQTAIERDFHPPVVKKLNYEFDLWPEDALIESFPCWIVTASAMHQIEVNGLTGTEFADVKTTLSEELKLQHPNRKLPEFVWLKVVGTPGRDDFGVAKGSKITGSGAPGSDRHFRLVISQHALDLLRKLGISHAEIEDFDWQTSLR